MLTAFSANKVLLAIAPIFLIGEIGVCQDVSPTAASVEAKAKQLIETRKAIAAESAAWTEQKQLFSDLIALRKREIAGIDEFTASATDRIAEVKKKRAELENDEAARKQWRVDFEKRIAILEDSLRPLVLRFPPPLRDKIEESLTRLDEPDPEIPLQNRFRDLAAIVNASAEFQNTITVSSDIREVGDRSIEVDVFYLGLTQAWYVDRTGKLAGTGVPTNDGWKWTGNPKLASKIREAIDIQSKVAPPGFVELPIGGEQP